MAKDCKQTEKLIKIWNLIFDKNCCLDYSQIWFYELNKKRGMSGVTHKLIKIKREIIFWINIQLFVSSFR